MRPEIIELFKNETLMSTSNFFYDPNEGSVWIESIDDFKYLSDVHETIDLASSEYKCQLILIENEPRKISDIQVNTSIQFVMKYNGKSLDEVFHDEWDK